MFTNRAGFAEHLPQALALQCAALFARHVDGEETESILVAQGHGQRGVMELGQILYKPPPRRKHPIAGSLQIDKFEVKRTVA